VIVGAVFAIDLLSRKEEEESRERERLAAIEAARVDTLMRDAQSWWSAKNVREFIRAVQEAVGERSNTIQFATWSRWASADADKLDPIASGRAVEGITNDRSLGLPADP
jgi:hypothetical protein